jgi:uncharacterized integral membrane protein
MRLFRGSGRGLEEFQPRLWLIIVGLSAMALYLLAFIVMNDKEIEIEFVFFTAQVSQIWGIVLIFGLGVLGGVLLSQLYRRRRGDERGEPSDGVS